MSGVDIAYVYYSKKELEQKNIDDFPEDFVHDSFGRKDLKVFTDVYEYCDGIRNEIVTNSVVLLMSSGDFAGIHLEEFTLSL